MKILIYVNNFKISSNYKNYTYGNGDPYSPVTYRINEW